MFALRYLKRTIAEVLLCFLLVIKRHTRRDRVWNEVIRDRVGVALIDEKLTQLRLRWFGYVQRRPEAPVCNVVLERVDNVKRGRCRPKLTWDESVKRDIKDWNISKEIALDRSAWILAINVPEPWTYFFRVSSLAYPNLLGKKGYVVVVVVIVVWRGSTIYARVSLKQMQEQINNNWLEHSSI